MAHAARYRNDGAGLEISRGAFPVLSACFVGAGPACTLYRAQRCTRDNRAHPAGYRWLQSLDGRPEHGLRASDGGGILIRREDGGIAALGLNLLGRGVIKRKGRPGAIGRTALRTSCRPNRAGSLPPPTMI